MQWGDGNQSVLASRDVIQHWSRLLFDFLVRKISWRLPTQEGNTHFDPFKTGGDLIGNPIKVLCKFHSSHFEKNRYLFTYIVITLLYIVSQMSQTSPVNWFFAPNFRKINVNLSAARRCAESGHGLQLHFSKRNWKKQVLIWSTAKWVRIKWKLNAKNVSFTDLFDFLRCSNKTTTWPNAVGRIQF